MDPTSILFSPPRNAPDVLLSKLATPWFDLGIKPRAIGRLAPDEEGNLAFAGKVRDCGEWEELIELSRSAPPQAVHFASVPAKDDVYVYQWNVKGERRLSAELGIGRLRFFESDEYSPVGRYQVALMLALAAAAGADTCAYGKDYDQDLFVALDPSALIEKLRAGNLLTQWTPAVFLISIGLIDKADVEAAIQRSDASHLKYRVATTGYHVLSQYATGID